MPPSISVWRDALSHVVVDVARLVFEKKQTDSGYVFPEPGLFIGVTTSERQAIYFSNWLKYRSALIHRQSFSSSASPINNQQWRTLLFLPLNHNPAARPKHDGSSQRNRTQMQHDIVRTLLRHCLDLDEELDLRPETKADAWWNGEKIMLGRIPPVNVAQQILWELCQLNFQYELSALDHRAHVPVVGTIGPPRDQLILACFPGRPSLMFAPLQSAREGLAAPDWRARRSSIAAMRTLMKTWKGFTGFGFHLAREVNSLSEREFQEVESSVAHLYTQFFYDYFARAAVVPHTLPPL